MGRKIKVNSRRWEVRANMLARGCCPPIYSCQKCNNPYLDGYCCDWCKDDKPFETAAEKANHEQEPEYEVCEECHQINYTDEPVCPYCFPNQEKMK